MTKVLVLYYSAYGHIERMAHAVAEGVRSVAGSEVTIKRVAELVPEETARKAGMNETEFRTVNNIPARMLIKAGLELDREARAVSREA